jgi:hypothetical protein
MDQAESASLPTNLLTTDLAGNHLPATLDPG